MVAASILLNTNVTLGTIFSVGRDVVCRLTVICTLCQPSLNSVAVRRSVVRVTAFKTKPRLAGSTHRVFGDAFHGLDDDWTIGTRTESQVGMASDIVKEAQVNVPLSYMLLGYLGQNQILPTGHLTARGHTGQRGRYTQGDLSFTVSLPTLAAKLVSTALRGRKLYFGKV